MNANEDVRYRSFPKPTQEAAPSDERMCAGCDERADAHFQALTSVVWSAFEPPRTSYVLLCPKGTFQEATGPKKRKLKPV